MFALKLILMVAVVNLTTAWIAPERCQGSAGINGRLAEPIKAQITTNLHEESKSLKKNVDVLYKDYKVYHVPLNGSYDEKTGHITVNSTNNCEFEIYYNYLSDENCGRNNTCSLRHEVRGTEYYYSFKGRKWGGTVSNKSSFITIGGEASTDDRYSCYNNKKGPTNRTVECSTDDGGGGELRLYEILTEMACDFGTINLEPALRDNKTYETAPEKYFSKSEKDELLAAALTTYWEDGLKMFHMDTDKISEGLFDKLMTFFPNYDFSTDTISIKGNIVDVNYYQATNFRSSINYRKLIPITNENGDAIYEYVCELQ